MLWRLTLPRRTALTLFRTVTPTRVIMGDLMFLPKSPSIPSQLHSVTKDSKSSVRHTSDAYKHLLQSHCLRHPICPLTETLQDLVHDGHGPFPGFSATKLKSEENKSSLLSVILIKYPRAKKFTLVSLGPNPNSQHCMSHLRTSWDLL